MITILADRRGVKPRPTAKGTLRPTANVTLLAVLVALFAALTLAACGRTSPQEGGEGDGEGGPAKAPAVHENDINALPRDQVQDGGRLTWPIDQIPVNFNYNQIDGTEATAFQVLRAIVPLVFMADASATPHWNPDYLASEPTVVTEPKQVVTYHLNPKATWDDGTPMTWEDFYWQWKASNGTNTAYQISSSNGYEDIENVEKGRDDREVVVTFKHKYADWQNIFNPFYPASTNKSPQVFNEGWKAKPLTSGGPFKFQSIDQTAKTVTLVRNEKWWGAPAKLDSIVYRAIDRDAQIDALANGEVDLIDVGPDVNKYNRAKGVTTAELRIGAGPNFRHITINGTGEILRDLKVRQAIAKAIDRTAVARAMVEPLGIKPQALGNHIFMSNQAGYRDNSGDVGKYDPQVAGRMLDEAGWKLEGDVRKKNGRALEITIVIPSAVATSRQESELIQNMLGRIGVALKIDVVPGPDFFDKYVRVGQFDFTVFSWIGTPFPISSTRSLYAKPTVGPGGELAIKQNYARVGSEEIDALYDAATQELDRQKAIDEANRLDALIWQEVHSLTLYQRPEIWAAKKGLANIGAVGFADPVYEDIGWAKK
jgi:peptide/nickel transport system substrate-binding protein